MFVMRENWYMSWKIWKHGFTVEEKEERQRT